MKTIVLLFVITICANPLSAQDFRNATWGMTPSEVKSIEPDAVWEKGGKSENGLDIWYFSESVLDHNAYIICMFSQDTLVQASYLFSALTKKKFVRDFYDIKHILDGKYQKVQRSENWSKYRNNSDKDLSTYSGFEKLNTTYIKDTPPSITI